METITVGQKIRVEQIQHDIAVLDTAIYFHQTQAVLFEQVTTEIELHRQDGFGRRKHRPDFVYTVDDETTCVEVELSLKAKNRLENIIKENFAEYDFQVWVVPDKKSKIASILEHSQLMYPDIKILELSEVKLNE